jgi:hypothetical protein
MLTDAQQQAETAVAEAAESEGMAAELQGRLGERERESRERERERGAFSAFDDPLKLPLIDGVLHHNNA